MKTGGGEEDFSLIEFGSDGGLDAFLLLPEENSGTNARASAKA